MFESVVDWQPRLVWYVQQKVVCDYYPRRVEFSALHGHDEGVSASSMSLDSFASSSKLAAKI